MDENYPPTQKCVRRRKHVRNKFTRRKNDERKVQAASRKALQQISTNMPPTQNTFEELMKVDLPTAWTLSESQQDGTLMYCMLRSDPPTVIRSVTVSSDLQLACAYFFWC